MKISRTAIETSINRCRNAEGTDGCTLPPDVRALADVWAKMNYFHLEEIDVADLDEKAKAALARWQYA